MRIVSLCPSITKLVYDLGAGETLIGRTKYCIHPAEEVATIEALGGTKDPDIARIIALEPDLVLLNREENRREDWSELDAAGLRTHVSHPCTVDETIDAVRDIGAVLNRLAIAETIVARIQNARSLLHEKMADRPAKSWAYLIWRKPWMTVNRRTYIHNLLCEAGSRNIFADLEPDYPSFEPAQLTEAQPDLVLLSSEPFPFKEKHILELVALTNLPIERFHIVDGEHFSWHAAFTVEGLEAAARLF